MKRHLLLSTVAALALSPAAMAADFQVGNLYYDFVDKDAGTVAVAAYPTKGQYYSADEIVVPPTVEYENTTYKVTSLGYRAFAIALQTTSITLPEGLETIEPYAIYNTGITQLTIPSTVTSLGDHSVYDNKKLTKVNILADIEAIPQSCFDSSAITEINFPESLKTIGEYAFKSCALREVTMPASLRKIDKKAFYLCKSLQYVTLNEGLESIGGGAFEDCTALQEITIPGSVQEWTYEYGTYHRTFAGCWALKKVVLDEGVTEIPNNGFAILGQGNGSLSEIVIPASVTSIGNDAFYNNKPWRQGSSITFKGQTPLDYEDSKFISASLLENCTIYVPAGAADAYRSHSVWGQFKNIVEVSADIDAEMTEPLKNALGHGNSMATLTLHWGDEVALDNLTEGVRFGNEATAGDVIATALREDPRFYALKNAQGVYVAFGFDTNGDNSAAVSITGTPLDLVDGVAVADGEYADATASSAYDHWNISDENNCWKVFVNGALADFTTTVSNSDVLSLEYLATEATTPAEKTYTFYLRPADRIGIWLPEEVIINTADGKSVTVPAIATIANEKANLYGAYLGIDVFMEDGIKTSDAYRASFSYRDTDKMSCTINVSTPANAILRPYLNIRKDWGTGKAEVKRVYPDTDTKVSTIVAKPLTGISLDGIEPGGVIEVDNMGVYILKPVYEPADADFTGYNATFANEEIATLYKSVNSVVAHAAGETTLTISSTDGSISSTYTVRVKDVDPGNRPENFTDGMVWLNEEWFGHTSGSLNYIDANGDLYTRAYGNQNGNMAFGATSQYGTVYAGKYIIISKQPWDGGDTRPLRSGGRVVVFDAETFEHLGAIDEIGGDGRSCVGVSPSKVYLGTSKGIRVMNLDDITVADADITGIAMGRSGQIGNMVKAGKYVFATNIGTGLSIIDTTDDSFVKTIPATGIQGVVQSADGRVWIACSNNLTPVDPVTLETGTTYNIPGSITCSTYSWRSVNILAAHNSNTLIWGTGTFYRWNLDEVEDPSTLSPVYTHTAKVDNVNYGNGYGAPGYDEATDTYMYATQPGFGAAALQNWYHFVNASTGEMKARIHLPEYWWFPAMPINPDKHAPEILMEDITLDIGQEAAEYDLSELVNDADNHNCNISVSLVAEPAAAAEEDVNLPVAETSIEGNRLTVTPNKVGEHSFTLMAESNGRTTTKTINVTVKDLSGISSAETVATGICKVYDTAGIEVATFRGTAADADTLGLPAGIYLVTTPDGSTTKVVIK